MAALGWEDVKLPDVSVRLCLQLVENSPHSSRNTNLVDAAMAGQASGTKGPKLAAAALVHPKIVFSRRRLCTKRVTVESGNFAGVAVLDPKLAAGTGTKGDSADR